MPDLPSDPDAFVRTWLAAFNQRDWDRYGASYTDDVTYLTPGRTEPLIGRQAHLEHDQLNAGGLQLECQLVIAGQDARHVVVEGIASAPGRAASPWVVILEFRAGQIAVERLYFDRAPR